MLGYLRKTISKKLTVITLTVLSLCIVKHWFYEYHLHNDLPIILWWTPFMIENEKVVTCDKYECLFTINRNYRNHSKLSLYLFYGSDFKFDDLPLPKTNIPWAIYHEESPKNLPFFLYEKGQKLFNITSTFSRNSHFPIPLQYLDNIDLLKDLTYFLSVEEKNKLNNAPILYIQSDCETPIQRDYYVKELMKYIEVDSYGKCLNNKKIPSEFLTDGFYELYEDNFMKFVATYKFTIAIENAVCNDYITEKLWRPLRVGSVPIYLGSPTIKDWLPNNKSVILFEDFNSIKDLADFIKKLNNNVSLYSEYLQHKLAINDNEKVTNKILLEYSINLEDSETVLAFECYLCKNMYTNDYKKYTMKKSVYECVEPTPRSSKDNFWVDHWKRGKCEAKILDYFTNTLKLRNFTREMFYNSVYSNKNSC